VPRSGASFSETYEWEEAARWRGYKWEEFEELDGERQSRIVAHFRVHHQLEAVISHEQNREAKRRQRGKQR
jgi:hypothetical protein